MEACPHAHCVQDRRHAVDMAFAVELNKFLSVVLSVDLDGRVKTVDFQQVIISDVNGSIVKTPLSLIDDAGQVLTLPDIGHLEAVCFHFLHEILCGVAVVPNGQRINLVFLNEIHEPLETVVIIDVVLPGRTQQATLYVNVIRHTVASNRVFDPGSRKVEVVDGIELSVLLYDDAVCSQVCRLGEVDPAYTGTAPASEDRRCT